MLSCKIIILNREAQKQTNNFNNSRKIKKIAKKLSYLWMMQFPYFVFFFKPFTWVDFLFRSRHISDHDITRERPWRECRSLQGVLARVMH